MFLLYCRVFLFILVIFKTFFVNLKKYIYLEKSSFLGKA